MHVCLSVCLSVCTNDVCLRACMHICTYVCLYCRHLIWPLIIKGMTLSLRSRSLYDYIIPRCYPRRRDYVHHLLLHSAISTIWETLCISRWLPLLWQCTLTPLTQDHTMDSLLYELTWWRCALLTRQQFPAASWTRRKWGHSTWRALDSCTALGEISTTPPSPCPPTNHSTHTHRTISEHILPHPTLPSCSKPLHPPLVHLHTHRDQCTLYFVWFTSGRGAGCIRRQGDHKFLLSCQVQSSLLGKGSHRVGAH